MQRWDRLIALVTSGAQVVLVAGLGVAVIVDVIIGIQLGRLDPGTILSGLVVLLAVACRRPILVAATAAAVVGSIGLSLLDRAGSDDRPASLATVVGLGVLAAAVARHAPTAATVVLLPACVVAVLDQALRPEHRYFTPYLVLLAAIGVGACVTAGGYLRWLDWQRAQAAVEARTEERLDLARELHDLVAHYVTGIVVQAQGARAVAGQRPDVAVDALGRIEAAGADALAAMRRMVGSLRSDDDGALPPPAGLAGLSELVERSNALGVPARLHATDEFLGALAPAVASSVHRIVQESLTNVRRHARDVTVVDVRVSRVGDAVEIQVHDDGVDAGRPSRDVGYGLVGMSERAAALGGTMQAGPDPRGGWSVVACVPLAEVRR